MRGQKNIKISIQSAEASSPHIVIYGCLFQCTVSSPFLKGSNSCLRLLQRPPLIPFLLPFL